MVSFAISGDATEGDEVVVTITFDKPIDRSVTFTPVITGGTADEHDFTLEAVTLQPYTTVAEMKITTNADADKFYIFFHYYLNLIIKNLMLLD